MKKSAILIVLAAAISLARAQDGASLTATMITNALTAFGLQPNNASAITSQILPATQLIPYITNGGPILEIHIPTGPLILNIRSDASTHPDVCTNFYVSAWDLFYSIPSRQLIKAVSVWPQGVEGTRFPPLAVQEKQMRRVSESFSAIPSQTPRITLADALSDAMDAENAKQIIAYYVVESSTNPSSGKFIRKPRAVWIIHAWGIPGIMPAVPYNVSIPKAGLLNHLRSIVDAQTGEWYGADSIPQLESNP
jgi:hypothetical protein